ncbi:MAG: hypothetical protein R2710_15490 [Acidimicrobiales bacterium]
MVGGVGGLIGSRRDQRVGFVLLDRQRSDVARLVRWAFPRNLVVVDEYARRRLGLGFGIVIGIVIEQLHHRHGSVGSPV